jgi:hypothetical protein
LGGALLIYQLLGECNSDLELEEVAAGAYGKLVVRDDELAIGSQ